MIRYDVPNVASSDRSPHEPATSTGLVDHIDDVVVSRRTVLAGVAAATAGFFAGRATTAGTGFERAATLAGAATVAPETTYHIPAVDGSGSGIVIDILVEIEPGDGALFVDLDAVELRHDVQRALNEAATAAARVAGQSFESHDVSITFDPPGDGPIELSGKSWEAGLAVVLLGALTDRDPSPSTLVTGVLDANGALLPVGGVEEKAVAARAFGADRLLVPPDHAVSVDGIVVEAVQDVDAVARRVF